MNDQKLSASSPADVARAVRDRRALAAVGAVRGGRALLLAGLELRAARAGDAVVGDALEAGRARVAGAALLAEARGRPAGRRGARARAARGASAAAARGAGAAAARAAGAAAPGAGVGAAAAPVGAGAGGGLRLRGARRGRDREHGEKHGDEARTHGRHDTTLALDASP